MDAKTLTAAPSTADATMADATNNQQPAGQAVTATTDGTAAAGTAAGAGAAADGKKKKRGKPPGAGKKKGEGKRGAPKSVKEGTKKTAKRIEGNEMSLLKGVPRPAARRFFKQIPAYKQLRLADNITPAIRAALGVNTRKVVDAMVEAVIRAGRQTCYLTDSRAAVNKELPRNTVFAR